jgi:hypothetical protein
MNARRLATLIVVFFTTCPSGSAEAGDLTLAWDPPSDGTTTGYVLLYGTTPQSYLWQIDVGGTTSYTLKDLSDGATYYFTLRAYDAAGAVGGLSNEVSATIAPTPAVTGLALTASLPSPQVMGTSVTFLSTATGGVEPREFRWAFYQGGSWNTWPWTTSSTFTWTPSQPGNDYQVNVAVRSAGSISNGELTRSMAFAVTPARVSAVSLMANVAAPQTVGSTILWSAAASGGLEPYQYYWWLFDGKVWKAATAWTTSSTWAWTPTAANDGYTIRVWVRSAGQTIDAAEASASAPFPITSAAGSVKKGPGKCQGPRCK